MYAFVLISVHATLCACYSVCALAQEEGKAGLGEK